jgi:dTDP-glucose pyrophosphorylase
MMNTNFDQYLIRIGTSVKVSMKQLDSTHRKILFVTDENKRLLGSLSDGDIRRWILAEGSLDADVLEACNRNPYAVCLGFDFEDLKNEMIRGKFTAVPVINDEKIFVNIIFWDEIVSESKFIREFREINAEVVIMAGGQGTRLEPFTKILPKPLIPIGEKTIIEVIIDKFLEYKIDHFYVSVNHKARIIKSYFDEIAPSYKIRFIEEKIPLGTIGALTMIKGRFKRPVLVTNCDIIIDTNYADFLDFHNNNKYDISLVASLMHHRIPYGICEIGNGGTMTSFKEKPEFSFLASTGMYIINPELINLIPENTLYHITQLMQQVRDKGGRIGVFPISEDSWLDTGEWHEYKKTLEKFKL